MHLPRVWAEIDLMAVASNLTRCRECLTRNCDVLGVVKADAYGHGAVAIASTLERGGISMLGVGDSHEAIELREAGITAPILVLGAVVEGEIPDLIHHWVTPTIHSPERIEVFDRAARSLGVRMPVHLLIDTGMSRLGVATDHAGEHIEAILGSKSLALLGISTHLASPHEDPDATRFQIDRFHLVVRDCRARGIRLPRLHVASSAALLDYPEAHFDLVRLGGFLYGIAIAPPPDGLRPILSLYTQIVYLRDLPPGTPVGYGGTHRTRRPTRLATLPVGYHDGYLFSLSDRAEVLVRGQRAPVLGRITMDYFMIDVTDVPGASVGDPVTLIGRDGGEEISTLDLAQWAQTTPYEIPSHIGNRVQRRYIRAPKMREPVDLPARSSFGTPLAKEPKTRSETGNR